MQTNAGLGFSVWALGFNVQSFMHLGFWVPKRRFRVLGLCFGLAVQGFRGTRFIMALQSDLHRIPRHELVLSLWVEIGASYGHTRGSIQTARGFSNHFPMTMFRGF